MQLRFDEPLLLYESVVSIWFFFAIIVRIVVYREKLHEKRGGVSYTPYLFMYSNIVKKMDVLID